MKSANLFTSLASDSKKRPQPGQLRPGLDVPRRTAGTGAYCLSGGVFAAPCEPLVIVVLHQAVAAGTFKI
jgi:hypothetical protein